MFLFKKLRDEVARTHDQVRRERARSPVYRDYGVSNLGTYRLVKVVVIHTCNIR